MTLVCHPVARRGPRRRCRGRQGTRVHGPLLPMCARCESPPPSRRLQGLEDGLGVSFPGAATGVGVLLLASLLLGSTVAALPNAMGLIARHARPARGTTRSERPTAGPGGTERGGGWRGIAPATGAGSGPNAGSKGDGARRSWDIPSAKRPSFRSSRPGRARCPARSPCGVRPSPACGRSGDRWRPRSCVGFSGLPERRPPVPGLRPPAERPRWPRRFPCAPVRLLPSRRCLFDAPGLRPGGRLLLPFGKCRCHRL